MGERSHKKQMTEDVDLESRKGTFASMQSDGVLMTSVQINPIFRTVEPAYVVNTDKFSCSTRDYLQRGSYQKKAQIASIQVRSSQDETHRMVRKWIKGSSEISKYHFGNALLDHVLDKKESNDLTPFSPRPLDSSSSWLVAVVKSNLSAAERCEKYSSVFSSKVLWAE